MCQLPNHRIGYLYGHVAVHVKAVFNYNKYNLFLIELKHDNQVRFLY